MRRIALTAALLLAVAMSAAAPGAGADDGIPIDMGPENECLDLVPHAPTDYTRATLRANVVVALDGVSLGTARRIMAKAAQAYAPAGPAAQLTPDVDLNVIAYHDLTGRLRSSEVTGFITNDLPTGETLMDELIRTYNTTFSKVRRHHVHLLTSKDIYAIVNGDRFEAVLGIANCIGAIGTKHSFTIAEVGVLDPIDFGPFKVMTDLDAKTTAHEIGHTFGAHHHYANCGQRAAFAAANATTDACTLMFNDASMIDLHLGPVEVAAIRGTAEAHLGGTAHH